MVKGTERHRTHMSLKFNVEADWGTDPENLRFVPVISERVQMYLGWRIGNYRLFQPKCE